MHSERGNIFISLIIGVLLLFAFGFSYYFLFHQTKVLPDNIPSNQNISGNMAKDTPQEPNKTATSSWDTLCDGYYLRGDTSSIILSKNYDLKELEQKAKEQGFMTLYNHERFHQGGPLQSIIEKGIPAQKNSTIIHNGVTYKTTEEGYDAFAPQLQIQKVINGGTYRITLAHHWNLEGSQAITLETDSLTIPIMDGQKTDRVSDGDIINHFTDIVSDLEIESKFLENIRVQRNACPMSDKNF